jgi:twinkle protein
MRFEELGIDTRGKTGRYATTCPKCDHTRTKHRGAKCLTVNDEPGNQWFKCNHPTCGWAGNLEGMDKYKKVHAEAQMPTQQREFSMDARDYLQKRGLSTKTAKQAKLYEQSFKDQLILCFPYFVGITLVNVKFVNTKWVEGETKGPKWWQLPKRIGTKILPFMLNQIRTRDEKGNHIEGCTVIITEGEWDAMTWIECGYQNIVSVPQGAPSVNSKNFNTEFEYLTDPYVKSILDEVDMFVLCVDNDPAGVNLRYHLSMILGKEKCRFVQYPRGYKDINEVLAGHKKKNLPALGKEGVVECLKKTQSIPIGGIVRPRDEIHNLQIYRDGGFTKGLGCGIPEVDALFTIKPKHITFVTGVPGSGKSVWVRWWLAEMVRFNEGLDLKWAMFTPENRPVAREYAKLAEVTTKRHIEKDHENGMDDETYHNAMRWISDHFFLIAPDPQNYESFGGKVDVTKLNTIKSLQEYLMYLKKTENIQGYVIDAWNKIEHEQPKWQSETAFISKQLDEMIQFNDYYDLHGIIVVHPTKIESKDINYRMPNLYDIKGSSAWKEKADIGIVIHRYKNQRMPTAKIEELELELGRTLDDDEKVLVNFEAPTIIRTEKIRFEELGKESRVRMEMSPTGNFYLRNGKPTKEEIADINTRIEPDKEDEEDDDVLLF